MGIYLFNITRKAIIITNFIKNIYIKKERCYTRTKEKPLLPKDYSQEKTDRKMEMTRLVILIDWLGIGLFYYGWNYPVQPG